MYKACSRCGKIHDTRYQCNAGKTYKRYDGEERKLRSKSAWTKKSLEIREKANWLCEVCRDKGIYTYESLEVHHITKVKDDSSKLLDDLNLVCLCVSHHKQADYGQIDADFRRNLARMREGGNIPHGSEGF